MGALTDVAILAFYGLTFLLYLLVTAAQVLAPSKDERISTAGFLMKLLLRMGLGVMFYFPVTAVFGRLLGRHLDQRSAGRRRMILDRVYGSGAAGRAKGTPHEAGSPVVARHSEKEGKISENPLEGWKGIIGFFHPFWYVRRQLERRR